MIKVIEHGYNKYKIRCDNCSCYYEYELEDIVGGYTACPDCGNMCQHYSYTKDHQSQIKDSVEIKE